MPKEDIDKLPRIDTLPDLNKKDLPDKKSGDKPSRWYNVEDSDANYMQLNHTMQVYDMAKVEVDFKCPEEVEQRIADYFKLCLMNKVRPSKSALSMALGISRWRFLEFERGQKADIPKQTTEIMYRAARVLDSLFEEFAQTGQIPPQTVRFLGLNNYGYTDASEINIKVDNTQMIMEGLQEKYIEALPPGADVDEDEN